MKIGFKPSRDITLSPFRVRP